MKKNILTLAATAALTAAVGLATPALAQQSAVTNANLSLTSNQLDKAITSINEAIANDKTKDKAKTWFVRGEIYYRLLDPNYATLTAKYASALQPGEALQKATESYNKALALDGPTGEFGKQVPDRLKNLYGLAFNDAVKSYTAKDYDKAIAGFRLASQLNPQDTTAVLYTAITQDAKQDNAGAKATYNQLLAMPAYQTKPASVAVYSRLLEIARAEKNTAEGQQVVQKALAAYPNNKQFLIEDLNLSGGGGTGAIDKLNKVIASDPNNASLYAVRGSLYDQQKKTDLAQADYKKAIELDPKNFDAQFNLGIYNFNQAAVLYTKTSKMSMADYKLKGKQTEAEGKKYFEAAVPYFESALAIQPNDPNTLNALQKVYYRLGRTADSERMAARLAALPTAPKN